jgi:hypothetical protein
MSSRFLSVSRWFKSLILLLLTLVVLPAHAQDNGAPNPSDLATRLLGYQGEPAIPAPSPVYTLGDTLQFWVSKAGHDTPVQITAELAAAGTTAYVWVEQGITYDKSKIGDLAARLGLLFDILRVRSNYGSVTTVPQSPTDLASMPTLQMPDVDNDPHLYILYASDLSGNPTSFYDPANSLETSMVSGGYTNQHELVVVNTSNFPGIPLNDPAYISVLARQFYAALAYYNNPAQSAWLREATSWDMFLQIQQRNIQADDLKPFFATPDTPLLRLPTVTSTGQEFGAQQLFLRYVLQRFGFNVFRDLFVSGDRGLSPLDSALSARNITDLVTGNPVTARDVFADFVMANALNVSFGDGRYYHMEPATRGLAAAVPLAQDQFDFDLPNQTVNQLGTNYFGLSATKPARFSLLFVGQETVARLPMPTGENDNHFYWSGDAVNRDAMLTRAFDLTGVKKASLTFDTWYLLTNAWNYAYVEVSADNGVTWDVLPATNTTTTNPYALAYGAGFTGISNAEAPRPFPYLGVGLNADGITIASIVADGPLADTQIQAGDTIAGYDGKPWPGQANLLGYLADFDPGDTVNLYVQRGQRFFDVPVVLGSHPTRRKVPDAVWIPQTVDLSAYVGKTILVRFESISLPGHEDRGIAIDNIAVHDVGFQDDAESGIPGWTLDGWQQTTNEVRQQFVVQAAIVGTDPSQTKVMRLISPSDTTATGAWDFTLQANETLILAVSGLNDDTTTPALYTVSARAASN